MSLPQNGPLAGRVALVTGVSHTLSIGTALARRLHDLGATVTATGWRPHDEGNGYETPALESLPPEALPFDVGHADMANPNVPTQILDDIVDTHGRIDIVVATHARSASGAVEDVTAEELDACWAVNVRSVLLLAQAFARLHDAPPHTAPPTGRMLWFTSGQHLGPMESEIAYAVSKGALHQMTASISRSLAAHRIIVNCLNPGPVDTGYVSGADHAAIASMFPDGRWGAPRDIADVVAFLVSDEGAWIRGQVLNVEGGFER